MLPQNAGQNAGGIVGLAAFFVCQCNVLQTTGDAGAMSAQGMPAVNRKNFVLYSTAAAVIALLLTPSMAYLVEAA